MYIHTHTHIYLFYLFLSNTNLFVYIKDLYDNYDFILIVIIYMIIQNNKYKISTAKIFDYIRLEKKKKREEKREGKKEADNN